VSQCPWSTPKARLAMDLHYKIKHAHEEIERLNLEVPRFATQLRDEGCYLEHMERTIHSMVPHLAHQIGIHRAIWGRFDHHHWRKLRKITCLPSFSGSIAPGVAVENGPGEPASV
ncbi:hypothetical protein FIBSPDRAFT_668493, partial [Athelia psychrophila]